MTRPELKGIMSIEVDDLETWQPDGPEFDVMLDLEIGAEGERGAELFHLYVASPARLEAWLWGTSFRRRHTTPAMTAT